MRPQQPEGIVHYYEFSHNNVIYTFKNPFFLDRMVNAKFNNNIFYGAFAGGQNKDRVRRMGLLYRKQRTLRSSRWVRSIRRQPRLLLGHASTRRRRSGAAEALRNVEVKNNAYFWPAAMTAFHRRRLERHGHVDSIYTPMWMNASRPRCSPTKQYGPDLSSRATSTSIRVSVLPSPVLNPGTANANGVGLIAFWVAVRNGLGTTETYGYNLTQIPQPEPANWTPAWPLPEANDMKYTNVSLKTAATDGSVLGDPNWWGITLAVTPQTGAPQTYALSQNYPNPFNPATKIDFSIPTSSQVQLRIYNVLGQEVATLVNETLTPGSHTVTFDASRLASGIYMYKITAGSFVSTRKMVLLK